MGIAFAFSWIVDILESHWLYNSKRDTLSGMEEQMGYAFLKFETQEQVNREKRWIPFKRAASQSYLAFLLLTIFSVIAISAFCGD